MLAVHVPHKINHKMSKRRLITDFDPIVLAEALSFLSLQDLRRAAITSSVVTPAVINTSSYLALKAVTANSDLALVPGESWVMLQTIAFFLRGLESYSTVLQPWTASASVRAVLPEKIVELVVVSWVHCVRSSLSPRDQRRAAGRMMRAASALRCSS